MGIYYKEWLESKWRLIAGALVLSALSLLNVVMYPWVETLMTPEMAQLMESMMKQLIPFIEMPDLSPMLDNWNTYLYGSWISKTLYQSMVVFILIMASSLSAGEESKGTLEFLWAKPISTLQIISAKYFVNLAEMICIAFVSTFILYPASLIMGKSFDAAAFALGLLQAMPGYMLLFSMAFLMSTMFKDSIKSLAFSAVAFSVLSIPSFLPDYRHLSIFRFLQGFNVLSGEGVMWATMAALTLLSAVLFAMTYFSFNRKQV